MSECLLGDHQAQLSASIESIAGPGNTEKREGRGSLEKKEEAAQKEVAHSINTYYGYAGF